MPEEVTTRVVKEELFVAELAHAKGKDEEFGLYQTVERLAPELIAGQRKMYKGVNTNVDFYSGFVYHMLGLPVELYTPMFAVARIVGWSAHRLEEIVSAEKIIRPAYVNVHERRPYVPMDKRHGMADSVDQTGIVKFFLI